MGLSQVSSVELFCENNERFRAINYFEKVVDYVNRESPKHVSVLSFSLHARFSMGC